MKRYGIAEWYGEPFRHMPPERRRELARIALDPDRRKAPDCPFQPVKRTCSKKGGVCSIRPYRRYLGNHLHDRIGEAAGNPVITCPRRFEQANLVPRWLARIVGFNESDSFLAREVPFMRSPSTNKPAGRMDLVVAGGKTPSSRWYGLEMQAVYFSGKGMDSDFEHLAMDDKALPPASTEIRRPDWRSSSAKRLMPQLQIKAPTLRRWATKLAVAVDAEFFEAIGGQSQSPSHDLNEGDIIWLVPEINEDYQLKQRHWEVLSLEASSDKLLAAETVKRLEFEQALRDRLRPLEVPEQD